MADETSIVPFREDAIEVIPKEALSRQHDDQECGQCTFVANRGCVHYSPDQERGVTLSHVDVFWVMLRRLTWEDKAIPIGLFTMPGWNGHTTIYLFHCMECGLVSRDYLHGYPLFLSCEHCDTRHRLSKALPGQKEPMT
jgi:hypothetical protein